MKLCTWKYVANNYSIEEIVRDHKGLYRCKCECQGTNKNCQKYEDYIHRIKEVYNL